VKMKLSLALKIFGLEIFGSVLSPVVGCYEHGNRFYFLRNRHGFLKRISYRERL
jgi:hypothetical protein